jgi:hypothetical protein
MVTAWRWTGKAAMAAALVVAGCVSANVNMENLLGQAGFRRLPADTPAKVNHLQTLPPRRLVGRTHQGKKYYVYADPEGCKCLYIGNATEYQSYRHLVREQKVATEELDTTGVEEAREWEIENSGLQ